MASISSSSLSFSFAPIEARPRKRQKTQQRFELIEGGFQENMISETILHQPPFQFAVERYCTAGEYFYPITLTGRVALFDALSCLKMLEEHLPDDADSLPLQHDYEPYSAFHWALQAPRDSVSEHLLKTTEYPLACKYDNPASICDTCLPKAMYLVEKTQRHKKITEIVRRNLIKLRGHLSVRLGQRLVSAWESKNLQLIRLCLEKGTAFNRNTMGKMLLQGIEGGFDAGISLLLNRQPSLALYATPDTGSKIWCITALHVAAASGRRDICDLLVRSGANPTTRTQTRRTQRPGEIYTEYGLRERVNRGFTNLVHYANNLDTGTKEHWDVFTEVDLHERSLLLALFIKTYSLFSTSMGPPRGRGECQKTEEVIAFLLQMGADPGIPDKNGVSLIDWIRNCRYLVHIDPTAFFTSEYVERIIQKMEQSSTVRSLLQLIAEYAEMQNSSAISIIWSTNSQRDDRRQDPLLA